MARFEGKTNEQAEQLYEELKMDITEEEEHYSRLLSRLGKLAIIMMALISFNTFIIRNLYVCYFFNVISIIFPCIGGYLYLRIKKYRTQIELLDDEFCNFYINNTKYLTLERKERFLFKYQKARGFNKPFVFIEARMEELKNKGPGNIF
ncbi:hypothetical protein II7_05391 [Bacillus cereus MSX-A12]|uniref:hypothetical protein n=1 Tax=Bacillus paranthracis TaxID=2026186 RepID=UPI00027969C8|nr:hypothetical protein II7_05391 [Bacillus cereus MSX-A12]